MLVNQTLWTNFKHNEACSADNLQQTDNFMLPSYNLSPPALVEVKLGSQWAKKKKIKKKSYLLQPNGRAHGDMEKRKKKKEQINNNVPGVREYRQTHFTAREKKKKTYDGNKHP